MVNRTQKHRGRKVLLLSVLGLLAAAVIAFAVYTADFYRADATALAVLQNDQHIEVRGNLTILSPQQPNGSALIFYPGGKVEAAAYLPLLQQIKERGITCILVAMPFNLAVLDINAAEAIYPQFPEITHWYIGGHSLGGAMASSYASSHPNSVEGLVLLGAYLYGDFPAARTLTVYGTLNTEVSNRIDYTENVVVIQGGNHAQFGNYGQQRGDPPATVTQAQQQAITVDAITAFIRAQNAKQ